MGQLYLTNVDFLKNGVPASVIAALVSLLSFIDTLNAHRMVQQVVASLGYALMKLIRCVGFFYPFYSISAGLTSLSEWINVTGCERRTGASSAHLDAMLLLARISLPRLLNLSKCDALRSTIERRRIQDGAFNRVVSMWANFFLQSAAAHASHLISHHYPIYLVLWIPQIGLEFLSEPLLSFHLQ
jgi:hypothetical protein